MTLDTGVRCGGDVPYCGWVDRGGPYVTAESLARVFSKAFTKAERSVLDEPAPFFAALSKLGAR